MSEKNKIEARLEALMSLPSKWTTERRELVAKLKSQLATFA